MPVVQVPIVKAKTTLPVDTDAIPPEVYAEAVQLGLKVLANRGTSKITKSNYPDPEELKMAALEAGQKQIEAINAGTIKFSGSAKATKVSGKVMVEARRIAKAQVKAAMRDAGLKVTLYKAAQITALANDLIAEDESIIAQAEANLAEQAKAAEAVKSKIDLSKLKTDPGLVAKAAKAKSDATATASATQAGRVMARQRGQGQRPNA